MPNLWASCCVQGWGSVLWLAGFQNPMEYGKGSASKQRQEGESRVLSSERGWKRCWAKQQKIQINMYLLRTWKTIVFLRLLQLFQSLSLNVGIMARIIDLQSESMEKAIWIQLTRKRRPRADERSQGHTANTAELGQDLDLTCGPENFQLFCLCQQVAF